MLRLASAPGRRALLRRLCIRVVFGIATGPSLLPAQTSPALSGVSLKYVPLGPDATASALDAPVSLTLDAPLRAVLTAIANQAHLSLAFDDALPGLAAPVSFRSRSLPARLALARALEGAPLQALVSPAGQIVLVPRRVRSAAPLPVSGVVRDADTGAPISGVRVVFVGTRFSAQSTESGTVFLGDIPPGPYHLDATRLGYEPQSFKRFRVPEDLADGRLLLTMHRAAPLLSAVVVTPGYYGLLENTLGSPQSLSREQLETVPQIGEDIYRAVARLPGVSADDFSAKFSVRGGGGDELYASLDGLELVEPFHLKDIGGAFSIVDIQSLGTASLVTGGFPVEYGDRLTGVFTLTSADPRTDRLHTSLGLSLMNARATMQGGFAGGKGGWLLSARPGFIDLALRFTSYSDSIKPRYYDVFAKTQYDLGRGGVVAMHLLHAKDNFRFLQNDEPNITSSYASSYAWLTWDDSLSTRLRQRSVVSLGALDWSRHGEQFERSVQTARIDDGRTLHRVGLRQDWLFDASPRLSFKWGIDAKQERASYDYFSAITVRQRDGMNADTADTTAVAMNPQAHKVAWYLAPRFRLTSSLTAELGVRQDRNSYPGETITSPRLNLSWTPASSTTFRAAWGRYSQSQALFALHAEDGDTTFGRAEHAEHRVLSVEHTFPLGISGQIEAYEKRRTQSRAEYTNAGGEIRLFPEVSWDRLRIDRTGGRDRGLELQVSQTAARQVDWSLGYALASTVDYVAGRDVPRSSDARHTVHFDWSVHPANNAWRLSVGGLWHSGLPYTPTVIRVDTLVNTPTRFQFDVRRGPGEYDSARLPAYSRIDTRLTRYINTGGGRVSLFGEVYNLLGAVNVRGLSKDAFINGRRVSIVTKEFNQWPRLPIVGLTWEF